MYQSILHLSWVDKLLDNIKKLWVGLYAAQLKNSKKATFKCDFDPYFDQQIREFSGLNDHDLAAARDSSLSKSQAPPPKDPGEPENAPPVPGLLKPLAGSLEKPSSKPGSEDGSPSITPDGSRPVTPSSNLVTISNGPRTSRRAKKAARVATTQCAEVSRTRAKDGKGKQKSLRKWDADGNAVDVDEEVLDYSAPAGDSGGTQSTEDGTLAQPDDVDLDSFGTRNKRGDFILKDLDDEVHSILKQRNEQDADSAASTSVLSSSFGAITGYFKGIVGGKTLTKSDLDKPLKAIQEHLVKKNVAHEAAVRLVEGVEHELLGVKTGSFESIDKVIRTAMTNSLQKILTPTTSLDILRAIDVVTRPMSPTLNPPRPYVISIVGVNGVGKSTNLSKLAFFLLQNGRRVLLAAGDTFRSGAVEQLRVHARNLAELAQRQGLSSGIELFERGYGKDAAHVAKDAVAHAAREGFDVVLVDTAGRRHNDARLMSSLENFAQATRPDKILMVGEALVGSDSVMQARNFNAAFGPKRGLDGFIISKCDTVGDMVGSLVSMVHATGIPVVFLGIGQHYGDLRTLNVGWAVGLLMS